MKKILFIFIVTSVFLTIGCNDKPAHVHVWDEGKTTKLATCIENGEITYTCIEGDATKTETIKASEKYHNFETGTCPFCGNTKESIDGAVARVGKTYYKEFKVAVHEAQRLKNVEDRVIEVIVETVPHSSVDHIEICRSLTINGNNANFNHDGTDNLAFFTYSTEQKIEPETGEVNITINDAKNLSLWGEFKTVDAETKLNITLNNVHNEGISNINSKGYLVMFRGADSVKNLSINLTVENSSANTCDNGIHFIFNGDVTIKNCDFENVAVPVNFAHKGTEGTLNLTVKDCSFVQCGVTPEDGNSDLAAYSAPIRLTQTGKGSDAMLLIKNNKVEGTRGFKGDVLLVDDRDNKVILPLTAKFEGNKTALNILAEKGEEFIEVKANETKTIEAGTKPNTVTK